MRHDVLDDYEYASDPLLHGLRAEDKASIRRAMIYGKTVNGYGLRLMAHQNRVAKDGAGLLRHLGYSRRAAANLRAALMFHDIGKTAACYDPAFWMQEDRPPPEIKNLLRRHARIGADDFEAYARACGLEEHPHYKIRHAVTRYHHERLDGQGVEKIEASLLPDYVRIACIADAYDGDRIWRPHQPRQRTPRETLDRMADPAGKYAGAFDEALLTAFREIKVSS